MIKKDKDKFVNIEYLQLFKNKNAVYTFDGVDVEGKTKKEIQLLIGNKFGNQRFSASIKYKDQFNNVVLPLTGIKMGEDNKSNNEIKMLSDKLDNVISSGGMDNTKFLLDMQKQTFDFIIAEKDKQITRLENEVKDLNNDLDDFEKQLEKLNSDDDGGIQKILSQVSQFYQFYSASKGKKTSSLKGLDDIPSDSTSIPPEFLHELGKIDYEKIPAEQRSGIINMFRQFSSNLPLKGKA